MTDENNKDEDKIRYMRNPEQSLGMQRFGAWMFGKLARGCSPTDMDFQLHDKIRHRFLWIEFKPEGVLPEEGQMEGLIDLAKRGDTVIVVWDPYAGRMLAHESVPRDTPIKIAHLLPTNVFKWNWVWRTTGELDDLCGAFMDGDDIVVCEDDRPWIPNDNYPDYKTG